MSNKHRMHSSDVYFIIKMNKIHFFNPGHEAAICFNKTNYTPPSNVLCMINDLTLLPAWYADKNDFVLSYPNFDESFILSLPKSIQPQCNFIERIRKSTKIDSTILKAEPWGISPHSIGIFKKLASLHKLNISIPEWNEKLKELTGRETAARCLQILKTKLPNFIFPEVPAFFDNIGDIIKYIENSNENYILKAPYSSSGRGILWIKGGILTDKDKQWINGILNKQKIVSIEKALKNCQDFAWEFYANGKGSVLDCGISVFGTAGRGNYTGNLLGNQSYLESIITQVIDKKRLETIKKALIEALQQLTNGYYKGYLGVDLLLYQPDSTSNELQVHPCVEINFRYTMGLVAIALSKNLLAQNAKGYFQIVYHKKAGQAFDMHKMNQEKHPIVWNHDKITKGYLSLCPVTEQTHYTAEVFIG